MKAAVAPWLRGYRRSWLRGDVVAGLTVWAVLVPESLAYATIAGVDPVVGLYAAPAALVLYALFGSSRHLVVGPMSATAALSAAVVGPVAAGGGNFTALTAALAVVTGAVAVLAGLLRFGFLAGFISEPVLKGFIIGLALTILAGQLPKLLGAPKSEGDFFARIWGLITQLGHANGWAAAVGIAALALVLALRHWLPLIPASLVAVAAGVAASILLDLQRHGVALVGHITGGLPPLGPPPVAAPDYSTLVGGAVGVALVGFAEGLGAAKTYAARAGYDIDPNRELAGLGAANLGAGLCAGMPVNGSLSKTAVNGGAGARSQVSGLTAAALTVLTLLFLTALFERLPEPVLAAIVIAAVVDLIDFPALARLYRVWTRRLGRIYGPAARADFLAALAALAGVLIFDTLPGLFLGIGISLLLLLYRASRPNIAELGRLPGGAWVDLRRHPNAGTVPGIAVVRVEGGLFFANAERVRSALRTYGRRDGVHAVVLDAETVPFVDVTAAEMLLGLNRELARNHAILILAHDIGQVRDVLVKESGDEYVYRTVDEAVTAAEGTGAGT